MASKNSTGRGGAGNATNKSEVPMDTTELATPTIKQDTYTTGRGGSGNMVNKDSEENARKAQDIEIPEGPTREKKGTFHWGRGGEGNKATVGEDANKDNKDIKSKVAEAKPKLADGGRRGSWKEKGKEVLGLKDKTNGGEKANASAIED